MTPAEAAAVCERRAQEIESKMGHYGDPRAWTQRAKEARWLSQAFRQRASGSGLRATVRRWAARLRRFAGR